MHMAPQRTSAHHAHRGHTQTAVALLTDVRDTLQICIAALLGERMIADASRLQPLMMAGVNVPREVVDVVEMVHETGIIELLADAADDLGTLLAADQLEALQ